MLDVSGERVPLSPLKSSNELNINKLGDFSINTGAAPGQFNHSLYGTLMELCKEKKMSFFKPTPHIDYIPPRLVEGKEWVILFYVKNPYTGKMVRIRKKFNKVKSVTQRRKQARQLMAYLEEKLALGWNPLFESAALRAGTKISEVLDTFIKIKSKEAEENSLRSYKSYVKIFRAWLEKNSMADAFVCSITRNVAIAFMEDVDSRDDISARTYNNYLMFFRLLFNWMREREYVVDNPFDDLKRKPKKLTKKKRRVFTADELNTLFEFLGTENRNFLCLALMCYCCFLRPKEIVMLKCSDIDLDRQVIHIREEIAKNDKDSFRTIPDVLMPELRRFDLSQSSWYIFGDSDYLFRPGQRQMCSRKIARYWDAHVRPACGFDKELQFYGLKDTGVTNMLIQKVPINLVQKQADHHSVAMTAIYVGTLPEANEQLKEVDIVSSVKNKISENSRTDKAKALDNE